MSPHRIANVDLDVWERQFVSTTIDIVGGLEIAPWECVGNPDAADVVLVNVDTSRGAAFLEQHAGAAHTLRPVVVPCARREGGNVPPGQVALGRPIAYAELIALLRQLEAELRESDRGHARPLAAAVPGQPATSDEEQETPVPVLLDAVPTDATDAGDAPVESHTDAESASGTGTGAADPGDSVDDGFAVGADTDIAVDPRTGALTETDADSDAHPGDDSDAAMPDPTASTGRYLTAFARPAKRFFPDTRLAGILKKSLGQRHATEIRHPVWPTVTIYPMLQAYTATADPLDLVPMFRTSALEFDTRQIDLETAVAALDDGSRRSLWRLFFAAYLHGSEGRLLPHGDSNDWLHLYDTPNLEELHGAAEHRRLAEYLQGHSQNLAEIVQATGINIEIVIDFCNACEAIGLLERISATGKPATLVALRGPFQAIDPHELLRKLSATRTQHGIAFWLERVRQLFR